MNDSGGRQSPIKELEPESLAIKHNSGSDNRKVVVSAVIPYEQLYASTNQILAFCQELSHENERVANWLLDNDYLLTRAVKQVKKDLPDSFYFALPRLILDEGRAIPRVLDIAYTILGNAHLQIQRTIIVQFITDYQKHISLRHGELWALPAILRYLCIAILIKSFQRLEPQLQNVELPFPSGGLPIDDPGECIARVIASLAVLNTIDWKSFVDQTSELESLLEADPAGAYSHMNFSTRERYRKAVEHYAKCVDLPELEIADRAIALAAKADIDSRESHIGYWLIDDGRSELEAQIGLSRRVFQIKQLIRKHTRTLYGALLVAGTLFFLAFPYWYLGNSGAGRWMQWLSMIVMIVPASVLSISVVHWLVPKLTRPIPLPALDFKQSIPSECRCAVAIPVILSNVDEANDALNKIELLWMSNPDPSLRYVLLSDPADADEQRKSIDVDIESALQIGIDRLNTGHAHSSKPFALLHRHRQFNSGESCWMAWERKRGKIELFNQFLLNGDTSFFPVRAGSVNALLSIAYVITLDADTLLPPGAAAQLVGTLAHPLNKATVNPNTSQVEHGYTVLQPRVELVQDAGDHSVFAKLFAGDSAIDIYSRAVSDVYQDLFKTGLYMGKGIYDVKLFQQCVDGRMPENRVLSHDLIEGVHGRVGLASNIVVYENFPDTYPEFAKRQHRWIRGDWQLLPWLTNKVPIADGSSATNRLTMLDRWKLADNLRRSLVPPVLLALLILGWLVFPGSAVIWTLLGIAVLGSYLLNDAWKGISQSLRLRLSTGLVYSLEQQTGRWFLSVVFLVNDSLVAIDAVVRTLWRTLVSHQRLLEWRTTAHSKKEFGKQSSHVLHWQSMWPASFFAVVLAAGLYYLKPQALWAASPVLLLWAIAPEIAFRLGRRREFRRESLSIQDKELLTNVARRTWNYFDTYTRPQDHWLPPDNFQEEPKGVIAHRTSPTNVGMYFVSALVARDFGFIGTHELMVRYTNTFDTLERLEMYQGHLLNWYDTSTLEPLLPKYVSTVDNGNFAVCLLTVKQGCLEFADRSILDDSFSTGLHTCFRLLIGQVDTLRLSQQVDFQSVCKRIETHIRAVLASNSNWLGHWRLLVNVDWPEIQNHLGELLKSDELAPDNLHMLHTWYERFNHQLLAMQRDLDRYFPWLQEIGDETPSTTVINAVSSQWVFQPISILLSQCKTALTHIEKNQSSPQTEQTDSQSSMLGVLLQRSIDAICDLQRELRNCARRADSMAYKMNFDMLYDTNTHLFRIGYNVSAEKFDQNSYDLLASEARLASFFAIAKKDVPISHWSHLGRPMSRIGRQPVLLSWSGSMFEYLMPPLFLPGKRDTLLGESERLAVVSQCHYARRRDVPWGISESAFSALDADDNYQYRAFGVPGLGIRRGLEADLVVAPYASALALCVFPASAVANMRKLQKMNSVGIYGFIDALDFTPNRRTSSGSHQAVRTYMAHHQGMTLAAIDNALLPDVLVKRVLNEKSLKTVELLLQERIPWDAPNETRRTDEPVIPAKVQRAMTGLPSWEPRTGTDVPQMQLLGNGELSSWISASGGGALFLDKTALTRWSTYPFTGLAGPRLYVALQGSAKPTLFTTNETRTLFAPHYVQQHRRFDNIQISQNITVVANDNVEIRTIKLVNDGNHTKRVRLTSYAEVALAQPIEHERHPAFSKLFVFSQHISDRNALIFNRRSRENKNQAPVLLHQVVFDDPDIEFTGFDTNRLTFLGRHGVASDPAGLQLPLKQEQGWTQDAIMALQVQVTIEPGADKKLAFLTIAAPSKHAVLDIASRYPSSELDWVVQDAAIESSHEIKQLGIDPDRLGEMQALVSALLHPVSTLRIRHDNYVVDRGNQSVLWQFGLSGDIPILLLIMDHEETNSTVEHLIRAQHLWRRKGLEFDLVIMRRESAGYEEPLREQILSVLSDFNVFGYLGRKGGIHLLSADHIEPPIRNTVESLATIVLHDNDHSIANQMERLWNTRTLPPFFEPIPGPGYSPISDLKRPSNLLFNNGFGGFDSNTGNYIIHLEPHVSTPAPWCNVIANALFGTVVTESGLGFSWFINSGEFRLTPWANDPVADTPSEILYLRDEMNADCWTVTPEPMSHQHAVQIEHGPGYTKWLQHSRGLEQTLEVCVAKDNPVKLLRLRLVNPSSAVRRITATYFVDWCLGAVASQARPHVRVNYDADLHTVFAKNAWNSEFSDCVSFVSATRTPHSLSGDRSEFLGPMRNVKQPQGLQRWDLGGHFSEVADTCAAYQVHLDIAAGATEEVVFVLGAASNQVAAEELLSHLRSNPACATLFDSARAGWQQYFDSFQVKTPDAAFDLMVNRWLPYQTLACRVFARAGYYQAGGAYGFRDQLQDVLALIGREPDRVRAQICEAASHQFEQGDALHWWHPPAGRGVRTRCSDDFLWLAYVVSRYVVSTGDYSLLDVQIPFLRAPELRPDELDRYALFEHGEQATVYAHCCRALQKMQSLGIHGLPLIGDGDWNDGMNRIGSSGHGESVWLAWFQIETIQLFTPIARTRGDTQLVQQLDQYRNQITAAVEASAWDGDWYIRAFDDNGIAWGSSSNEECKIDSLAQSWAVLSGAAETTRARQAMKSAKAHLLDTNHRLVRLLTPPFEQTTRDPGYIKAYPPGVRENGGQYTHAACWFGLAAASLGDGDTAWQVFDIISPIRRTLNINDAIHYAREPYVLPGDVSGSETRPGHGGWSWYTGAASWAWQLAVHGILGINYVDGGIAASPRLPKHWDRVEVAVRKGTASIVISIENPDGIESGVNQISVDNLWFRCVEVHRTICTTNF